MVVVACPVLKTRLESPLPGFVPHRREIQVRTEVVTLPGGVDTTLHWRLCISSHGLYRVCSSPDYEGTSALATVVSLDVPEAELGQDWKGGWGFLRSVHARSKQSLGEARIRV